MEEESEEGRRREREKKLLFSYNAITYNLSYTVRGPLILLLYLYLYLLLHL
jgi:hypothetical protein